MLKEDTLENTIQIICEWIDKELKNTTGNDLESIIPDMIKALSDLINSVKH